MNEQNNQKERKKIIKETFDNEKYQRVKEKIEELKQKINEILPNSFDKTIKKAKEVIEISKSETFFSDNFEESSKTFTKSAVDALSNITFFINAVLDTIQVGIVNGPVAYISNIIFFDSTNLLLLCTLSTLCGFVGFFLILLMLRVLRSGMLTPYAVVVPLDDLDDYAPAEPNNDDDIESNKLTDYLLH